MTDLPVIDVAPLLVTAASDATPIAAAIDAAARQYGFFYAEGHGIASSVVDRLAIASRRFFALPEAAKAQIAMARGGRAWRGWFPLGGELTSGRPDRKEGLYFGEECGPDDPRVAAEWPLHGANLWPPEVPELRDAVEAYLAAAIPVARALTGGMALALGLSADHFALGLTARPTLMFRIFHYPPGEDSSLGVGEHTDYGFLTLLAQDRHGGLEVRSRDGEWIPAPPRGDALVVNVGDMFERMTRGRYRSAPHRVVNRSGQSRLSFPLFFDPDFDRAVEPLPAIADEAGTDAARWDQLNVHTVDGTYGDYLVAKVGKVFPELRRRTLRFGKTASQM